MPNSLRIIVHPHCGINNGKMPFTEGRPRSLRGPQEWARAHPRAEEILERYNLRDRAYRAEATTARQRRIPIILMDHDFYPGCINDDITDLLSNSAPSLGYGMAARVAHEVYRMKEDLVHWFRGQFGGGNIYRGRPDGIAAHLEAAFPGLPKATHIRLVGEFLHCCVNDAFESLVHSGYLLSKILREKCVE